MAKIMDWELEYFPGNHGGVVRIIEEGHQPKSLNLPASDFAAIAALLLGGNAHTTPKSFVLSGSGAHFKSDSTRSDGNGFENPADNE